MLIIQRLLQAAQMTGEKHFSGAARNPSLLELLQCRADIRWVLSQTSSQGT